MSKLFIYKVPRDYGFAPNPFWGYLTLATCKPHIRNKANVGDYVLGIGGAKTKIPGKILYLMEVEEVITYDEYWNDERFDIKKPTTNGSSKVFMGDNIYHHENGEWVQEDSHHSLKNGRPNDKNINRDTKSSNVLISKNNWWYLGVNGIPLPKELLKYSTLGIGERIETDKEIEILLRYMNENHIYKFRSGDPNEWENQKDIGIKRYNGI